MPRNGTVSLDNAVVADVANSKLGTSRVVALKGPYKVTIERTGPFPDGMELRPDDTIDVSFGFDQKVKA
jgi:hypothetical protein